MLQTLAHRLTNSLLHAPSARLRDAARRGDRDLLRAAERLYGSDSENSNDANDHEDHDKATEPHADRTQHPSQT